MVEYRIVIYRNGRYSGKIVMQFWRSDLHSAVIAADHYLRKIKAGSLTAKIFDQDNTLVHKIDVRNY